MQVSPTTVNGQMIQASTKIFGYPTNVTRELIEGIQRNLATNGQGCLSRHDTGPGVVSLENSQVLHLGTNSMSPITTFKLRSNALAIDYGLVRVHSKNLELWLPQHIEAYWGSTRPIAWW